jgi:putative membrane protein
MPFNREETMRKILLPFLLLFLASLAACAGEYPYGPGGGWGHMMYYGYGGGFMWILFIVVAGVLIYLVLQNARTRGGSGASGETPLDILKKRYAKGELTKDDFERMKKELSE